METTTITKENYELDLVLRRSSLDRFKRPLKISRNAIEFGKKRIIFQEVDGLMYGSLQVYVNGIKTTKVFEIRLRDKTGQVMRITFSSEFGINKGKIEDTYSLILDSLWYAVTGRMVDKYYNDLQKGRTIEIANCQVTPHGIGFKHGFFVKKPYFFTWDKVKMVADKGYLIIQSAEKKSICKRLPLMRTWNAVVLHSLLNWLWKEGRTYKLSSEHKTHQV